MLVNPGRSIFTANQQGQTLPPGDPEKAVIRGDLWMSKRSVDQQRVLALHLSNGSSLLISKSLVPTDKLLKRLGTVLLIVGGIGVAIAAIMTSQDSKGWLIGLVVSIVSVVLAAALWSSRRL